LAGESFGERLAAARQRKGLSIEQVSDALRIRASIINALERCDFQNMPLKGYSRNMVSSFARYVGLPSTELTEQFLREYHEFESLKSRNQHSSGASSEGERVGEGVYYGQRGTERARIGVSQRNKGTRSYWDTADPATLNRSMEQSSSRASSTRRSVRRLASEQDAPAVTPSYAASRSQVKGPSILRHPILVIGALVVILVAILIGWAFLANQCTQSDTGTLPATGASADSTDYGVDGATVADAVPSNQIGDDQNPQPKSFELRIEIAEGGASWLQLSVDGETVLAQVYNGPWKEKYTVEEGAELIVGAPNSVKVFRDGKQVKLNVGDSGTGSLELKAKKSTAGE
jgi:cytoskeletal protein RodZ